MTLCEAAEADVEIKNKVSIVVIIFLRSHIRKWHCSLAKTDVIAFWQALHFWIATRSLSVCINLVEGVKRWNWRRRFLLVLLICFTFLNSSCSQNFRGSKLSGEEKANGVNYSKLVGGTCHLDNEYDAAQLDPSTPEGLEKLRQCVGQEIWYKATAGNARFHQYYAQQRMEIFLDWNWVLSS